MPLWYLLGHKLFMAWRGTETPGEHPQWRGVFRTGHRDLKEQGPALGDSDSFQMLTRDSVRLRPLFSLMETVQHQDDFEE